MFDKLNGRAENADENDKVSLQVMKKGCAISIQFTKAMTIISKVDFQPGVIWGRLLVMTQTAQTMIMPTQMTITVAIVGTMMFKSNHWGIPGNRGFLPVWMVSSSSPAPKAPPIFSENLEQEFIIYLVS